MMSSLFSPLRFPRSHVLPRLAYALSTVKKVDLFIDKFSSRLPGCKGKNLYKMGRLTLAKSVLAATVTFPLVGIPQPKW